MPEDISILQNIRVISDSRPGHENQSIGLAEALRNRCGARVEIIRVNRQASLLRRIRQALAAPSASSFPQLIIAAGHKCHIPLLAAASHFKAKSVLIMKPSLPSSLFDLCIIPKHDFKTPPPETSNIILTQGALNRIAEPPFEKTQSGIILMGGPSKHYGCDEDALVDAIMNIIQNAPDLTWTIANSRRTPPDLLRRIATMGIPAKIVSHQTTPAEWMPSQLAAASQIWVTEDSVTMISEAITAQARVGLLPMPPKASKGRLVRAIQGFINEQLVSSYSTWLKGGLLLPPAKFHESARCADLVLQRFYPQAPAKQETSQAFKK